MPCSYCQMNCHNISACHKASFERAVSIYNDGVDLIDSQDVLHRWIMDSDGQMPSEAVWSRSSRGRRLTPAQQNVVQQISDFHGLRPDAPMRYGHVNINYIIVRTSQETRNSSIFAKKVTLVDNKIVVEQLEGEIGRAAHLQYTSNLRLLYLARQRTMQEQARMARLQRVEGDARLIGGPLPVPVRPPPISVRPPPIPVEELILHTNAIETTECPVCMDPLGNTNKSILRCGHQFCSDCIFRHFQGAGGTKCPCCRSDYVHRVPGWLPPGSQRPVLERPRHHRTHRTPGRLERLETMMERVLLNMATQAQTNG